MQERRKAHLLPLKTRLMRRRVSQPTLDVAAGLELCVKTIPTSPEITMIAVALAGYAQTPTVTKTLTLFSQTSTVAW